MLEYRVEFLFPLYLNSFPVLGLDNAVHPRAIRRAEPTYRIKDRLTDFFSIS